MFGGIQCKKKGSFMYSGKQGNVEQKACSEWVVMKLLTELNELIKETFNINSILVISHNNVRKLKNPQAYWPQQIIIRKIIWHTLHYIHEQVMLFSHSIMDYVIKLCINHDDTWESKFSSPKQAYSFWILVVMQSFSNHAIHLVNNITSSTLQPLVLR